MKIEVKLNERVGNEQEAIITIAQENWAPAIDEAVKVIGQSVNIAGFRQGKAPRVVVENHVGKETLINEALDSLIPGAYGQFMDEHKDIPVIDQPKIDLVGEIDTEKDLVIKATLLLKPELELGEYKGLEVVKEVLVPDTEAIDAELEVRRERLAKMVKARKNHRAQFGETVLIDFEGFVDGVAFEGGKAEGHALELGSNTFIPGFEEQLVGTKAEDEVDVNVTFPEEYHAKELAGKEAVFKVTVHEVQTKELPELNDEFAQQIDEECDTLDQLKEKVAAELKDRNSEDANKKAENELISMAVKNCKVEVPEVLVKRRIDDMIMQYQQDLMYQGLDFDTYLQYMGQTKEQFIQAQRPYILELVKCDLMLEKIVEKENIEATEEELEAKFEDMAKQYGQEVDKIKAAFPNEESINNVKYSIKVGKAMDLILDSAKITEKEITMAEQIEKIKNEAVDAE